MTSFIGQWNEHCSFVNKTAVWGMSGGGRRHWLIREVCGWRARPCGASAPCHGLALSATASAPGDHAHYKGGKARAGGARRSSGLNAPVVGEFRGVKVIANILQLTSICMWKEEGPDDTLHEKASTAQVPLPSRASHVCGNKLLLRLLGLRPHTVSTCFPIIQNDKMKGKT